jgi:hypothetical protein
LVQLATNQGGAMRPAFGVHDHAQLLFFAEQVTGMCVKVAKTQYDHEGYAWLEEFDHAWATRRW